MIKNLRATVLPFAVAVTCIVPCSLSAQSETSPDRSASAADARIAHQDTLQMTVRYGSDNDAQEYSKENQCFVITVFNGKKTGKTLPEIARIIQIHIVMNSMDVTYFLDINKQRDDATVVTTVYSKGKSVYRPFSDWDYTFTLTELNEHIETYRKIHEGTLPLYIGLESD